MGSSEIQFLMGKQAGIAMILRRDR